MALLEPTVVTSFVVGILAIVMGWLTYRSYQVTENAKLLFVLTAFVVFLIKAIVVGFNELAVPHFYNEHTSLAMASILDVIIVLLLFVPFVSPRAR